MCSMNKFPQARAHPWHGISVGNDAPEVITCYIEIVPTDTVKFEIDKSSGILTVDRPQKYSNHCPSLYGFIPQTYSGDGVGTLCSNSLPAPRKIKGDGDPIDICVLADCVIAQGDILVRARPLGGFQLIDGNEADDKIIAVLEGDGVYGGMRDISDLPQTVIDRLLHYFLTYKEIPGTQKAPPVEVAQTYDKTMAHQVIRTGMEDYKVFIKQL
jgi:inorganic pyrophosphatase